MITTWSEAIVNCQGNLISQILPLPNFRNLSLDWLESPNMASSAQHQLLDQCPGYNRLLPVASSILTQAHVDQGLTCDVRPTGERIGLNSEQPEQPDQSSAGATSRPFLGQCSLPDQF